MVVMGGIVLQRVASVSRGVEARSHRQNVCQSATVRRDPRRRGSRGAASRGVAVTVMASAGASRSARGSAHKLARPRESGVRRGGVLDHEECGQRPAPGARLLVFRGGQGAPGSTIWVSVDVVRALVQILVASLAWVAWVAGAFVPLAGTACSNCRPPPWPEQIWRRS